MKKFLLSLTAVTCMASQPLYAEPVTAQSQAVSTIEAFSTAPLIRSVAVSSDGTKVAIIRATSKEGDYVIEIRDTSKLDAQPIVLGANRMMVSGVVWLNNDKIGVMFRQILKDGARRYWVNRFAITDADGKGDWLIPFQNNPRAGFSILNTLPDNKDEILVETDLNNNYKPDVVRFNVNNGRTVSVLRGSDKISGGYISDADGDVRAATGWNLSDNAIDLYARAKGDSDWKLVKQISPKSRESYSFIGFSKENPDEIYVNANQGQDKTGIYLYNIKTGQYSERLFGLENVDADGVIQKKDGSLVGFGYSAKWPQRYLTDANEQAIYDGLDKLFEGKFVSIISRSNDDSVMVVSASSDKDPGTYYLVLNKSKIETIGSKLPFVDQEKLGSVKYISYKARDGRKVYAYVTLPKGKGPFPAVVLPHGGPWVRDTIVFDDWAQLLAYNGYVVIQPNYRGSTGYGIEHWTAGDNNWGLKMQDDLDDAAMYLVEKGLATKDKLAMFGWSYGGYAAFAASMRDNNIYQCTVAGAGVSDLSKINATLNENRFLSRLQRPTITGVSPLSQVEKVNVPILVVHGDIDGRVPVAHSREFVEKLKDLKKDHKYVELVDADHFSDTLFYEHKMAFYSELIDWLDNKCGLK